MQLEFIWSILNQQDTIGGMMRARNEALKEEIRRTGTPSYEWYDIQLKLENDGFTEEEKNDLYIEIMLRGAEVFTLIPDLAWTTVNITQALERIEFNNRSLAKQLANKIRALSINLDSSGYERLASLDGLTLEDVPPQFLTVKLCAIAVKESCRVLEFVPEELCTEELYKMALADKSADERVHRCIPPQYYHLIGEAITEKSGLQFSGKESQQLQQKQLFVNFFTKLHGFYQQLSTHEKFRLQIGFSIHDFINRYQKRIIDLHQIFGNSTIHLLQSFLISSPVAIVRFLDSYTPIMAENDITILNEALNKIKAKKEWAKQDTKKSAIMLSFIANINNFTNNDKTKDIILEKIKESNFQNISEFQNLIYQECKLACLYFLGMDIEKIDQEKFDKYLSGEWLIQLMIGIKSLNSNTVPLIVGMLKSDFEANHSFSNFCNNHSETGNKLGIHNQAIHKKLLESGINLEKALNYNTKKSLIYGEESPAFELQKSVWTNIVQIKELLDTMPNDTIPPIISRSLYNINYQLIKGTLLDNFPKELRDSTLNKISKNTNLIKNFIAFASKKSYTQGFDALLNELKNNVSKLEEEIKTKGKKSGQKFHIEQWDKARPDTYFLGNQLSCCLATNGTHFTALLERRMDDACLMHVVINEKTREPICGNWLFLAQDKENKDDIYVVANFFELKVAYANNHELSQFLVNELKEYTANYAKAIGAKGFEIRPLTYGNIPDFKLEKKDMEISKVGDFYIAHEGITDNRVDGYYLEAVKLNQFYNAPLKKAELVLSQNFFNQPAKTAETQVDPHEPPLLGI